MSSGPNNTPDVEGGEKSEVLPPGRRFRNVMPLPPFFATHLTGLETSNP